VVWDAAGFGQRRIKMRSYLTTSVVAGGLLLVGATVYAGQQPPPPIEGVTGTVAVKESSQQAYDGIHAAIVKTADGFRHLFHLAGRVASHGNAIGDQALGGLEDGDKVVVHYDADGGNEAADDVDPVAGDDRTGVDGVITSVDPSAKTIAIRLADGSRQTLRLTEPAPSGATRHISGAVGGTSSVVLYSNDEEGRRVAHYFTRVS
jgi:hypothetical protein